MGNKVLSDANCSLHSDSDSCHSNLINKPLSDSNVENITFLPSEKILLSQTSSKVKLSTEVFKDHKLKELQLFIKIRTCLVLLFGFIVRYIQTSSFGKYYMQVFMH